MRNLILVFVVLFLAGCSSFAPDATAIPTPKPTVTPYYRVNKSTGLYDAAKIDANMIAELSVGTYLKPAGDAKSPTCIMFDDYGTMYKLCKMEVVTSGKVGWVLYKWLDLPH